jgi:hypothetical protein
MRRSPIFALIALAVPVFAAGQQHGGGVPGTGHAAVSAPRVTSTPAPQARTMPVQRAAASRAMPEAPVTRRAGSGIVTHIHGNVSRTAPRGNGFNSDLNGVDFQDVPGLGFDYPHLAAVSGNQRHHRGQFGAFSPGFGGFLLGSPQVIVEELQPSETQASPAEDQYDADNEPQAEGVQRRATTRRSISPHAAIEPSATETASSSDTDPAEFVFVRRDGGLVFAVAYSWENGTLRYVSRDGMRRAIPRDAVDLTATQQFNEQRGLIFRAPA